LGDNQRRILHRVCIRMQVLYSDFIEICDVFCKSLSIMAIVLPYVEILRYDIDIDDGLVEIGESHHE
jgi:hypothetical protein